MFGKNSAGNSLAVPVRPPLEWRGVELVENDEVEII